MQIAVSIPFYRKQEAFPGCRVSPGCVYCNSSQLMIPDGFDQPASGTGKQSLVHETITMNGTQLFGNGCRILILY